MFIQSNQLLKLILDEFVFTNKDKFQDFIDNLSNPNLKILDNKTNNIWIKESLIYIFEQITIIYIQNLINENGEGKNEKRNNIILDLKSFFAYCLELLEYLYKGKICLPKNKDNDKGTFKESKPEQKKEEKLKSNKKLKKLFCLAFIRVYLKKFIDWVDKNQLKSSEIEEIIKIINGNENNAFRKIIIFFIYKIVYNMNQQDINKFLDEKLIDKFHLKSYSNFDLLKGEKNTPQLIEDKISKKTEKIEEKEYSKYETYYLFINKIKNYFRTKELDNNLSTQQEIYNPEKNEEKCYYPYYKRFLYSDYPDLNFYRIKLEEKGQEKYPVVDLYLNKENNISKFNKDFISFNFVINSLLNQYSRKISKDDSKKITFENTNVYKNYQKRCEVFIEIINSKNLEKKLTKGSRLENFLINSSTSIGKLYIEIYKEYANIQNLLLNEIIDKINKVNCNNFICQEINIQEAQKEDLLIENKSEFNEILLMNTFREIYGDNSKIIYNNYNFYSVNFDKIEKVLEDILIRNACFLKADEIIEMKFTEEDYLNDGLNEFNENIKSEDLNEKDKMVFLNFYEKYLNSNLKLCLEVNEELLNIINYINKNFKNNKIRKPLYDIINEGGFTYKINEELKEFMKNNKNIIVSKLSNLIIYLEMLYFKLAMEKINIYEEKIDEKTRNKINEYNKVKSGQLINKEKLSLTIIKFLLNLIMNQKTELIDMNDNIFDYLSNKFLWNNEIYTDNRFIKECEEYKYLGIYVKNIYDFYNYIANDFKDKFEKEKKEIIEKIRADENEKLTIEKLQKRELENKLEIHVLDIDEEDFDELLDI